MSLQMLLEGPDLDGILREVEANYGQEFRVIQAEQVRSGGMGGFFAKQHYEVTIEISDPDIIAGINAQKKKSDIPLTELATRSQNDQAAASSQEWARDLLKQASELNSNQPVDTSTEEPARKSSLSPLLDENDIPAHETSRWTRTLGRLSGKKSDSRPPSDRMLTATIDQKSRLRALLSSDGGVDDEEVPTTPAESTPTVQTAPVSTPDRDDVEDEVPPAARVVADMELHSIPGVRKNTGARAEMASSTLRKRTEKTSDSQSQPSHASMPSPDPIAAGPEAPERSTEKRTELDSERAGLQDDRDELLAYRGELEAHREQLEAARIAIQAKATELHQEEEEARAHRLALGQESMATDAERQRLEDLMTALAQQQQQLSDRQDEMQIQASEMDTREAVIVAREEALAGLSDDRAHRENELQGKPSDVVAASANLEREWEELKEAQSALSEQRCALLDLEKSLEDRETSLDLLESSSAKRGNDLRRRENAINDDSSALTAARHHLAESEREFQTWQEAWTSHQEQICAEMKDAKEHVDRLLVKLTAQQDQLNVCENDLQDRWSILEAKEAELTARDEALKSGVSQADARDSELDARASEISSFIDELRRDRNDLSQRRAAVEAFEVEVDGRGERVRLLEEQVAEQRAAVESGRQELALAQDELAAARVSLEQEFEAKSAAVASREESLAQRLAETDERASALQAQVEEQQSSLEEIRSQFARTYSYFHELLDDK